MRYAVWFVRLLFAAWMIPAGLNHFVPLFPQPLGPTTPVRLLGKWTEVGSTKDLKPASLIRVSLISDLAVR